MDARRSILDFLHHWTVAWQKRRYSALERLLAPQAVFVFPGFEQRVEGVQACVNSYREFMERSELDEYEETVVSIDCWAQTAVATLAWKMSWSETGGEHAGQSFSDSGHDILVLANDGVRWKLIWRTIVTTPSSSL